MNLNFILSQSFIKKLLVVIFSELPYFGSGSNSIAKSEIKIKDPNSEAK